MKLYCNIWQRTGQACGDACLHYRIDWNNRKNIRHLCLYYNDVIKISKRSRFRKLFYGNSNPKIPVLPYCYKARKLKLKKLL